MNSADTLARAKRPALPGEAALGLSILSRLENGAVSLTLPDGQQQLLGEGPQRAAMTLNDLGLFEQTFARGDIGFAESFMRGEFDTPDLAALLTLLADNRKVIESALYGNVWKLIGYRLLHLLRANTRAGSRRNIMAHYDLGNDFYKLWLDPTMTYSSALFTDETRRALDLRDPAQSVEQLSEAQRNKYRRIVKHLAIPEGARILEIGCGWGGFAEVATLEAGANLRGLTLSPAQLQWAQQRARDKGFADKAEFVLRDYRDEREKFDFIVSIEMFEAVGKRYWPAYFKQVRDLLKPGGRAVIQVITIDDALFARYVRGTDFIQRYVFPGGMLPSPSVFREQARRAGLRVEEDLAFGLDYADTLAIWHQRFNAVLDTVRAQGFDETFIRLWQFYLAYCEAGFRAGSTDVHQYTLGHAQ